MLRTAVWSLWSILVDVPYITNLFWKCSGTRVKLKALGPNATHQVTFVWPMGASKLPYNKVFVASKRILTINHNYYNTCSYVLVIDYEVVTSIQSFSYSHPFEGNSTADVTVTNITSISTNCTCSSVRRVCLTGCCGSSDTSKNGAAYRFEYSLIFCYGWTAVNRVPVRNKSYWHSVSTNYSWH